MKAQSPYFFRAYLYLKLVSNLWRRCLNSARSKGSNDVGLPSGTEKIRPQSVRVKYFLDLDAASGRFYQNSYDIHRITVRDNQRAAYGL